MDLLPGIVLAAVLDGHSDTSVTLRYGQDASNVVFRSGAAPPGAAASTINLGSGWTMRILGPVGGGGVFANGSALLVLIAGLTLSALLGALLYVLGTGRQRAMVLVSERTDELEFEVLHDSLTRLPNRTLILDRIEQMLARARRTRLPAAAMYLDIDDFKEVNDAFGHAAGDQLLIAIGARLSAALREGDTVGRIGGDEFILLFEGESLTAGAEVVAERMNEVLQLPFEIAAAEMPITTSASIGIAMGERLTPDELLRMRTSPSTARSLPARAVPSYSPRRCRMPRRTTVRWRWTSTSRSRRISSSSSTNRLSIYRRTPLSASRHCCAGGIPPAG